MTLLTLSGSTRAAIERPVYSPGDRWVYVLEGSMGVPGFNDTENGTFVLTLAGRVEVEVAGFEDVDVNGTSSRAVRVLTRTSGFINGTFEVPGFPTPATVAGTISSNTSELWEDRGYQTISSEGTSETVLDVLANGLGLVELRLLHEDADGRARGQECLAVARLVQSGHDLEDAGFTSAVRSKKTQNFPMIHAEGDLSHRVNRAEVLVQ